MSKDNKKFDYESTPPGYYDLIHEEVGTSRSNWHRTKFKYVEKSILSMPSLPKKLIDYGCGSGTFLGRYLTNLGILKTGIDISETQITYARSKFGNNIHFTSTNLEIGSENFDVAIAIELIEHLSEAELKIFLSNCRKSLNEEGVLVLTTPNYKSFWIILEKITDAIFKTKYHAQHITKFSEASLKNVLITSGFRVTSIKKIMNFTEFVPNGNNLIRIFFAIADLILVRKHRFLLLAIAEKN